MIDFNRPRGLTQERNFFNIVEVKRYLTLSHKSVRIEYLDGMRGVAILLVILFHVYTRWSSLVPYGTAFSNFILAKYGWLGVELFFMISGFVIYMSLEKCRSFWDFIIKRWLRLFPAMLIVTALIYISAGLLPERPGGFPVLQDILPGLLFIDPSWISNVFNVRQGILEGAFWSLFVEVKFYIFFGGLYFLFNSRIAKVGILMAFLSSILATVVAKYLGDAIVISRHFALVLNGYLSFNYSGWFLVGVVTFDLYRRRSAKRLISCLSLGAITAAYTGHLDDFSGFFGFGLILLFIGSIYSDKIKQALSARCFLFIGFISYPLYLFHENFMIAVVVKSGKAFPQIPGVLLPLFPFSIACMVAFVVAK